MRENGYYHSYQYTCIGYLGDYQKYAEEVVIIMRLAKATYVAEDVFAKQVMVVKNNYDLFINSLAIKLKIKMALELKKSFRRYNKLMSKSKETFDYLPKGKSYDYVYQALESYINRMNEAIEEFDYFDSKLEEIYSTNGITASELLEFKRALHSQRKALKL